jgi:hypothetical protein
MIVRYPHLSTVCLQWIDMKYYCSTLQAPATGDVTAATFKAVEIKHAQCRVHVCVHVLERLGSCCSGSSLSVERCADTVNHLVLDAIDDATCKTDHVQILVGQTVGSCPCTVIK